MTVAPGARCRPHVRDGGFPNRGPSILRGEAARVPQSLLLLEHGGPVIAEPADPEDDFDFALVERGFQPDEFGAVDAVLAPAAAFVAGRCEVDDPAADARIDEMLRKVLADLDTDDLSAWALAYIESAMALALRGHHEGVAAIADLVGEGRRNGDYDYLAAYYLAQTGDPSGYPAIVAELDHPTAHYRLMAARHLVAFRPYDGTEVLGHVVDVRARLLERLDDDEDLVANEIPGLLAAAEVVDAREAIEAAAKDARHEGTREMAQHVLHELDEGASA